MVLHRQITACLPRPAHKYEGAYPLGFEKYIPKILQTTNFIHLFSGLAKTGHRVDCKPEVKPDTIADCRDLPFPDNYFDGGMADPMYETKFAKNLYNMEMPKWGEWTRELVRVVKKYGLIAVMGNYEINRLIGCQYWEVHYFANRPKHYPRVVTVFVKTDDVHKILLSESTMECKAKNYQSYFEAGVEYNKRCT